MKNIASVRFHQRIMVENSQQQDSTGPIQLNGDPVLNEFVTNFYTSFSVFFIYQ